MDEASPDNLMDLDIIDELLLDGCWLETTGVEFPHFGPVSSFEPWPDLAPTSPADPSMAPLQNEKQRSSPCLPENQLVSDKPDTDNDTGFQVQPEEDTTEMSKRWWIGPGSCTPVMNRLIQALGYLKNCSADRDALIQIWVPVNREGSHVLTTNDQPFSLDLNNPSLAHYREISLRYQFSTDADFKGIVGLPGRVFRTKVPEWTPDVRFFTWDEYPRINHAQKYDVRGSLVVPVLEHGSQACLGVIELVLTKQKIRYRPEIETVCKALEAVNLRTAELSEFQNAMKKTSDPSYRAALPEILDVLRSVCTSHKLPLAQTWTSCILQGKQGCRHSDENVKNCVSPVESACYVFDPQVQGFHEACSEYHLLKGLGVVGKAFETNQPCYSPDVTACTITEYPLAHFTRMFGLKAAVAIRLRSTLTGSTDFVLEFFLPVDCKEAEDQKKLLSKLSKTVQNSCRTLRVVTDEELQQEPKEAPVSPPAFGSVPPGNTKGAPSGSRAKEKRRSKTEKTLTYHEIKQHFAGTLKDAARNLGVCPTTLKRICRQQGIRRWPSRTIKKVGHSLQKIQSVIESVHGGSSLMHMEPFYSSLTKLADPKSPDNPKPDKTATSPSPSSSCSHSSSSKRSCSMEVHPMKTHTPSPVRHDDRQEDPPNTNGNVPKLIPTSHENLENLILAGAERDGLRMKVSYRDDTVRLRMQRQWKYLDLMREISRRFGVEDTTGFHLKYLDDDGEWILLTCDADLEECIDLYRSSPRQTIRLLFHESWSGKPASNGHRP